MKAPVLKFDPWENGHMSSRLVVVRSPDGEALGILKKRKRGFLWRTDHKLAARWKHAPPAPKLKLQEMKSQALAAERSLLKRDPTC